MPLLTAHVTLTDFFSTAAFGLSLLNLGLRFWDKRPRAEVKIFTAFAESRASSLQRVMQTYDRTEIELTGLQNLEPVVVLNIVNTGEMPLALGRRGIILPNNQVISIDSIPSATLLGTDSLPLDLQEDQKASTIVRSTTLQAILDQKGLSGKIKLRGFYEDHSGRRFHSATLTYDTSEVLPWQSPIGMAS